MPCEVEKCCFCVELRTGCYIIGFLDMVCEIIGIAIYSMAAVGAKNPGLTEHFLPIIIFASQLIVAICLICGIYADKRLLVFVYLLYIVIGLIISILYCIIKFAIGSAVLNDSYVVIQCLIVIYFWIVVRSYYIEMS